MFEFTSGFEKFGAFGLDFKHRLLQWNFFGG